LVNEYQQIGATDAAYINAGVLTPEQVALSRTEQPGFFPKVDKKLLKELEALRTERLLNPPDPMAMMAAAEEEPDDEDESEEEEADSLVFVRDGKTFIRSGSEEYEVGPDEAE
jgi:hypothetical protein